LIAALRILALVVAFTVLVPSDALAHVGQRIALDAHGRKLEVATQKLKSGVREAVDSTHERPIVRLGWGGFEIGRSLYSDVLYVAFEAAEEARTVPPDPIAIGAARILDVLELFLRRRRDGTIGDADKKALRAIERLAKKHLETRRWVSLHEVSSRKDERWQGIGWQLPARDDFDRAERVRHIVTRANALACSGMDRLDRLLEEPPDERRKAVKRLAHAVSVELVSEVWRSKTFDTEGRDKKADTKALEHDLARRFKASKLTGDLLARRALVACGLSRDTAKNWTRTGHVFKE
jgi:hypothetical protein